MSDHNNYDVVELLYRGWPHMLPSQRREAGTHIAHMLRWCLSRSLDRDGVLFNRDQGDQIPDSYYFEPRFLTPLDSSILPRSSGPPTIYLTRVQ
jgi:hypothetical protein